MRRAPWLGLLLGCASQSGAQAHAERAVGVRGFGRPPGMAIGTGAPSSALAQPYDPVDAVPAELRNELQLALPLFDATPSRPPAEAAPCSGCVELQLDVSDINQRDEFAIALGGMRLTRVVWTVLVTFNSDQLAVQPFIDGAYGKYSSLHVNSFPLATAVEVVQELDGNPPEAKAQYVGLKLGSSGAWTGDQTMSVFVSELRIEGPSAVRKLFDADTEGLQPRTQSCNPRVVFHARQPLPAPSPGASAEVSPQLPRVAR